VITALTSTLRWSLQATPPNGPIVVDLGQSPAPARDISVDVVLGMFAMAGVLLAVAAVGGVIVAVGVVLYKRRREAIDDGAPSHTRLKL
jgi:hypothetical protein